jgi:hypothetical protein
MPASPPQGGMQLMPQMGHQHRFGPNVGHFRSIPDSDLQVARRAVRFGAKRATSAASLDHLVGAGEQRRRHVQPERFSCFEINGQLEFGRRLHWKLTGPFPLEDMIDI